MSTMTLNDAAALLGLDPSTLRHQIRNGRLKARKIGPVWTVTSGELERYRLTSAGHPGRPLSAAPKRKRKAAPPAA